MRSDAQGRSAANGQEYAPEDALVIAEVLLRLKNAVADIPRRADGALNHHDLWCALDEAFAQAEEETHS